jgi:hypothetical protein
MRIAAHPGATQGCRDIGLQAAGIVCRRIDAFRNAAATQRSVRRQE